MEFGSKFNDIVCNAADLNAPKPGVDPVMARYTRQLLDTRRAGPRTMVKQGRQLAVLLLLRGHSRVEVSA